MDLLQRTKLLALEIAHLIEFGDLNDFQTYGKIGDKIEKLSDLRLDIIKKIQIDTRCNI